MINNYLSHALLIIASYFIIIFAMLIGARTISLAKQPIFDSNLTLNNASLVLFLYSGLGFSIIFLSFVFFGLIIGIAPETFLLALFFIGLFVITDRIAVINFFKIIISNPKTLLIFSFGYFFLALGCITPPGLFDDTMYQLPYAQTFLKNGGFQVNEWLRFPLFPGNLNLAFAACLSLGNVLLAQLLSSAIPIALIFMGIYGASKYLKFMTAICVLAVLFAYKKNAIAGTYGYAYVDIFLMYISFAAIVTILCANTTNLIKKQKSYFISGCIAGTAASIKLFGLVYAAVLFMSLVSSKIKFKNVLYYFLGSIIFGIFWYLRSYYYSGDPFHPSGGFIFGHHIWDSDDLAAHIGENKTHIGGNHSISNFLGLMKNNWGGVFLLAIIPPIYNWRKVKIFWFLVLAYLAVWYTFTPVNRYLAPIYPVAILLAFSHLNYVVRLLRYNFRHVIYHSLNRFINRISLIIFFIAISVFAINSVIKYIDRIDKWDQLQQSVPGYRVMMYANSLNTKSDSKLLQIGFENAIFFYDGLALGDFHGPARYRQFYKCLSDKCMLIAPEDIKMKMHQLKVDILIINGNRFNFEYMAYEIFFDILEIAPNEYFLKLRN
jgi:hypothetical protein